MDNQIRCTGYISPEERANTMQRIKAMKAELTTTNFKLGDEIPVYESINHEAMAKAETFRGVQRVGMNSSLKEAVKKSSIYFGNEPVQYETVAHNAMQYRGNQNNFSALKEEVTNMKASLRKHNFSFGDERVHYASDYHRGFSSIPREAYANAKDKKTAMRGIIEDSRRCHFSLGNDRPEYRSVHLHADLLDLLLETGAEWIHEAEALLLSSLGGTGGDHGLPEILRPAPAFRPVIRYHRCVGTCLHTEIAHEL